MGSDETGSQPVRARPISIHAPRMGSDRRIRHDRRALAISIHAPRMGSDCQITQHARAHSISIHAPRMGSDQKAMDLGLFRIKISIHAPRMGSDWPDMSALPEFDEFQSTLPGWGATGPAPPGGTSCPNFNPRSPDGERPYPRPSNASASYFNPRSPDGERLVGQQQLGRPVDISIHAPRMGSDRENGHLRPRYGQNHPFSTLIVSQIVVDVLGTVRKSQKTPAH